MINYLKLLNKYKFIIVLALILAIYMYSDSEPTREGFAPRGMLRGFGGKIRSKYNKAMRTLKSKINHDKKTITEKMTSIKNKYL